MVQYPASSFHSYENHSIHSLIFLIQQMVQTSYFQALHFGIQGAPNCTKSLSSFPDPWHQTVNCNFPLTFPEVSANQKVLSLSLALLLWHHFTYTNVTLALLWTTYTDSRGSGNSNVKVLWVYYSSLSLLPISELFILANNPVLSWYWYQDFQSLIQSR